MKVSVTSYSFSQLLQKGLVTQFSMIALAKSMGFEGMDFTDLRPPENMTQEEYAVLLKNEAARCGIKIVCYTIGANLLCDDPQAEVERLKKQVDVAAAMGAELMRHDCFYAYPAGGEPVFENYLDQVCASFREVADYAQTKNIRLCTENHGFICQHSERLEAIMKKVDHPNFGWLVDIGNFQCVNENSLSAVKRALPYISHVHVKDFIVVQGDAIKTANGTYIEGSVPGEGIVEADKCIQAIRETGYDGFYTLEYEGREDCIPALTRGLKYLKSL